MTRTPTIPLPTDLARRVRSKALTRPAAELLLCLRTFERMAGYPIPPELAAEFTTDELAMIVRILDALVDAGYGFLG